MVLNGVEMQLEVGGRCNGAIVPIEACTIAITGKSYWYRHRIHRSLNRSPIGT